jgi:quercetin dioxygenase-like cupin family protein
MQNSLWMNLLILATPLAAQVAVKFDTPEVRVIEAVNSPGQRSALHEHRVNRVMIYLDDGHMTLTDPQGREQDVRWRSGDVRWSPAVGPHISENVGSTTYRIVEVELKNSSGALPESALDPVRVAPDHYRVEFENPQVRVLRARYGPHEAGPVHEHILNRVMVYLTDQRMKVTAADGKVQMATGAAGEVHMGGAAKHQEENLSLLPFEVVVVELKR